MHTAKQVELTEADNELVDIESLEGDMQASLNALRWEFTHTVTPRLSPGKQLCSKLIVPHCGLSVGAHYYREQW